MLVLKTTMKIALCVSDAGTHNEDVHVGVLSLLQSQGEPHSSLPCPEPSEMQESPVARVVSFGGHWLPQVASEQIKPSWWPWGSVFILFRSLNYSTHVGLMLPQSQ